MPTLHDVQQAMRAHVLRGDADIAAMLADGALQERLDVYRNTVILSLTRALRLAFPAIRRLVGEAFFEATAGEFVVDHPPRAACLDLYGEDFPLFLDRLETVQGIRYLPDVARLEWAVNRALRAPEAAPVDLAALGAMTEADVTGLRLTLHPSLTLLELGVPAAAIWRAVLDGDDGALSAIDLAAGPVRLLVERGPDGVAVQRLDPDAWRFASGLAAGDPLGVVLAAQPAFDATAALAAHLAAGRVVAFHLS